MKDKTLNKNMRTQNLGMIINTNPFALSNNCKNLGLRHKPQKPNQIPDIYFFNSLFFSLSLNKD